MVFPKRKAFPVFCRCFLSQLFNCSHLSGSCQIPGAGDQLNSRMSESSPEHAFRFITPPNFGIRKPQSPACKLFISTSRLIPQNVKSAKQRSNYDFILKISGAPEQKRGLTQSRRSEGFEGRLNCISIKYNGKFDYLSDFIRLAYTFTA